MDGTYPSRMNDRTEAKVESGMLLAMRLAAVQRPRTQFVKIRWALLQTLLRERAASPGNPRGHPCDASGRATPTATTHSSPDRRANQRWRIARPFIRPGPRYVACGTERATGLPHMGHSAAKRQRPTAA